MTDYLSETVLRALLEWAETAPLPSERELRCIVGLSDDQFDGAIKDLVARGLVQEFRQNTLRRELQGRRRPLYVTYYAPSLRAIEEHKARALTRPPDR